MELLAPIGSFASFAAALEERADAVYIGAPALNARAVGRDFSYPEIGSMIRHAHAAGVKVYIAMNSLIKESELSAAVEGLAHLEACGADALIIQDLALARFIRSYFPGLALHASTLMSVHNSLAVRELARLGFKRVVLPRELTIEEIGEIHGRTGMELEIFIHGAMCFSYSGLCLFSSLHGGKSSLRGRCVQPCRRWYGWQGKGGRGKGGAREKKGGYLFSMHDLGAAGLLPRLRQAGVASLKIEGRLKGAEYVRNTVRAYRLLLDGFGPDGSIPGKKVAEAQRLLDEAMGRRRSTGFFLDSRPREAVTPHLSGTVGMLVGKVLRLEPAEKKAQIRAVVKLRQDIRTGDRLRLYDEKSGESTPFTLHSLYLDKRQVREAGAGRTAAIDVPSTASSAGREFTGSLFKVDIHSRRKDEEQARQKFCSAQEGAAPDQGKIRQILACTAPGAAAVARQPVRKTGRSLQWLVKVSSFRDLQYRLPVAPDNYILPLTVTNLDFWQDIRKKTALDPASLIWSLSPVIHQADLDWHGQAVHRLIEDGFTAFQLGHFSQKGLFSEQQMQSGRLRLFGDYTVNLLNSQAMLLMKEMGYSCVQFAIETDEENLAAAIHAFRTGPGAGPGNVLVGMYVFGHPPLFTARLDDSRYEYGKRFVSPKGEEFVLSRSDGLTRARSVLPFSLLAWRNNLAAVGVDYLVVDLSAGNIRKNLSEFIPLHRLKGKIPAAMAGNFQEGLL